jgi:integrase
MRFSHSAWYHVAKGKWTRLGDTYDAALLAYAKIEAARHKRRDVTALLNAFIAHPGRAATTTKNYRAFRKKLDQVFGHVEPSAVTVQDARRYLDEHPSYSMARHEIQLLSAALSWGSERGWLARNPLLGWKKGPVHRRKRYITDAELAALTAAARPDVAEAIRFLHLTALRVRDALALRWSDYRGGVLYAKIHKTKDALELEGPQVETQMKALRTKSVVSMHVLTGTNGRPLTYTILRRQFKAAATLAGCADVTIHDVRRKRLTDLQNTVGVEFAQKLAAHSDPKTTRGYDASVARVRL